MIIGVAYYPEQWPEDRWPTDARLMKETGIDVVRVGEFAWSRLEPRRQQFDMDWLHKAIEVLAEEGLKVILCTPTAAPPPWLFHRHPGMIPQDREGIAWSAGSRRHVCLNNRPYRRYARRIVRELARSFGRDPGAFAWQIDNELGSDGSGRCYCDDCEQAFREWLRGRYGTIERLNKMWGTVFWSQEFSDWHFIPAPRRTPAGTHPSLALDYERFISATFRGFVGEQREIIEQYSSRDTPITTNCRGLSTDQIDQFSLAAPQDVVSLDNYPVDAENLDVVALQLDLTRSLKQKPFWILEQQAGATMLPARRSQPRPGQLRLWSYQAAARGAELVGYFRWRTCPFAQQMHWHGMLDADGSPSRGYAELKQTMAELKDRAHLWQDKLPEARVAMVLDYHSHWALRADSMAAEIDYMEHFRSFYGLLRRRGLVVDVLPPERDPGGYSVLVVPMPVIARAQAVEQWQAFVRGGGVLLVTAPAGYRTEYNTWLTESPPGPLADLLGIRVVEHDVLRGEAENHIVWDDVRYPIGGFCSVLEPQGAEPLGVYGQEYYRTKPAITHMADGNGRAYFLGAVSTAELYDHLLDVVLSEAGVDPSPWLVPSKAEGSEDQGSSQMVEVIPLRTGAEGAELAFVLNHSEQPSEIMLPQGAEYQDLLTDEQHSGKVPLPGFGVLLLQGKRGAR